MEKLNYRQAMQYYEHAQKIHTENELINILENLQNKMDNKEYNLFLESVSKRTDKTSKSISRFYQHLFKTLCQPWEVHKSFYKTYYDQFKYARKDYYTNTNVKNGINANINEIIEKGYKDALKEIKDDKRGSKILKEQIYGKYDITDIDSFMSDKQNIRKIIVTVYKDLFDNKYDSVHTEKSLKDFDEYFK